ncbi:MAG: RHS repeat domain-containing protein [bacterium]|nr:RHS repeat domain-containing protein [bacterium]MDP3380652.1 RHS repeat domain-containing protein [bacterium]
MSASGSTDDIVQSITYDLAFNKPTQIVSPNGLTTNFTYDINGNVVSKQVI